ncbi:Copia-like polyprotein/retrotransposon, partial [Rhizoctonia solani AG-3 Rhs1AP]
MASTTPAPTPVTVTTEESSSLRINKLEGASNWKTWKVLVQDWLNEKDLDTIITSICPVISTSPPVGQDAIDKWDKQNRKVIATLRRNLQETVLTHVIACTTAKEVWDRLSGLYEITDIIELVSIRRLYFSHRMDESTKIEDHLKQMQEWHDKMRSIGTNYATNFDKAITLPSSLPPSWDIFVQTLQSDLNGLSTVGADQASIANSIECKIIAEGQRRQQSSVSNAMYAEKGKFKGKSKNSSGGNKNSSLSQNTKQDGKCNYCKKEGHWEKECRKKKERKRTKRTRRRTLRKWHLQAKKMEDCQHMFLWRLRNMWEQTG